MEKLIHLQESLSVEIYTPASQLKKPYRIFYKKIHGHMNMLKDRVILIFVFEK